MKKLLGILMILILIAGVFVSCSQDKIEEAVISGEELLDVSFDASSGRARDLVVDTPTFDDGDYIWYYTAQKDDTTGFNTGEKSVKTPVKDPTTAQTVADRKGLAGAVISGLSQGYWDFGLYAYVPDSTKDVDYDYSSGSVAWQGSVSHFLLVKGAANVVDVTVSPSTEGKGWLVVDLEHITVDDDPITAHPGTSLVYTVTPVGGTASVDISEPIDAGAYVVKVVCTGSNIDYAEDSIVVNVYSGLTRTVSGWIGELTTSAVFGDITGEIIEASTGSKSAQELKDLGDQSVDFVSKGTVPVTASLPATAAVALLPEVEPGTDQDLTLTLNVKSDTTVQTETTKKYDITLVQKLVETTGGSSTTTVSNVTSPLTKYLTATLTIDKNLSAVTVTHSGEDMTNLGTAVEPSEAQIEADAAAGYPGFYKYNAATGELKLMTMKFSPFQVSFTKPVDGIAAVYHGTVSTETLVASCKSLTDAIELAVDGDVVKVLQSTSYGSDAKISKAIKVDVSDENVSVVDITSPEEAIALAGRGYKGTYADDVLTITKTPITDAVARIDEGDVKLYFNTLQEAIDAALDGETVYLLCNENLLEVEANGKVLINKSITFDGNGYTISRKGESHLPGFALHVNGSEDNYINVVIQNLKIDTERSHGVIFNTYIDQAVMTDCSIDTKYRTPIYAGDDEPVSSVRKVILNNVSATMHEPEDRIYPWNNTALAVTYGATVIVNGGTYTAPISTYIMNSGGSLTIDGDAEFVATGNSTYSLEGIRLDRNYWEGSWNCDSILTIKDGSFDFTQATAPGINLSNSGDVAHVGWNDQVKLVIEGGTFTGFAVNGVDDNWCIATITGGTFDHDPIDFVEDGYWAFKNSDSTWTVREVEDEEYVDIYNMKRLEKYIVGSYSNGIIYNDIEVNKIMELGEDKVLDLNGNTLTVKVANGRPFVFSNSQSMVVDANGGQMIIPENAPSTCYGLFRLQSSYSSLVLNGGTYKKLNGDSSAIVWIGNNNNILSYGIEVELNDIEAVCIGQFVRDSAGAGNPAYSAYHLPVNTVDVNDSKFTFNNAGIDVSGSVSGFVFMYNDVVFDGVTIVSDIGSVMELDGGNGLFRNNSFTTNNPNNIQEWNGTTIGISYDANVTIESGTYTGPYGVSIFTHGGNLTIEGGTITGNGGHALDLYPNDDTSDPPTCIITGNANLKGDINVRGAVNVTVTGGTFDHDPSAYVAEGYGVVYDKETGLFEVVESWTKGIEPYEEATDLEIETAQDLARFAVSVLNAADRSVWSGKTVTLIADIDLSGKAWEPIVNWSDNPVSYTANLTFDGDGHKIIGMNAVGKHDVGLFASSCGVHVKNLTMTNATVVGINRVGAIAGHGMCLYCDDCAVENSFIMAYVEDNDDGDKAGGIVGYFTCDVAPEQEIKPHVTNCTVSNSTIVGYRDIGCIIGCGDACKNDITLTGLVALNNTIINDRSNNYKNYETDPEFNVGKIMGRNIHEVKFSECVNEGNEILVPNQD